jgi:hypothetical protein
MTDDEDTETCERCHRDVPYDKVEETATGYICLDCVNDA